MEINKASFKKDGLWLYVGIGLVVLVILYRFRYGEDSYVRIHDYAEVHVPLFKVMSLRDLFNLGGTFTPFLGGIPRNCLGSGLNIGNLLHIILPPFTAIVVNELIIRLTAFTGLYLFLKKSIQIPSYILAFATAVAFAVLPFYPPIYLSIAGLPLFAWALINISREQADYRDYLTCLLCPFFIVLVSIPGLLLFLFLIILAHWLIEKRFSIHVLLILSGIALLLILTEWRLIALNFLDPDFISHRVENMRSFLNPQREDYFLALLKRLAPGFIVEEGMHSQSYHLMIILPFSGIISLVALLDRSSEGETRRLKQWTLLLVTVFIISIFSRIVFFILQPTFQILREFQMERIRWINPPLFYISFAVSASYLCHRFRHPIVKTVVIALITYNAFNTFYGSKDLQQYKLLTYNKMTYSDFFAEPLFSDIRIYLQDSKVGRVVSVGINPGVALFNGFHTADGYWYLYDVTYKHRFRKVISGELEKNRRLRNYYDNWGHRVHMFYRDQKTLTWRKPKKNEVKEFSYNSEALHDLGVTHVFSAFIIDNAEELQWHHEKTFCKEDFPYCIHLYSLENLNHSSSN